LGWAPFNETQKDAQLRKLADEIEPALHNLAPNTGSYLNEVRAYERIISSKKSNQSQANAYEPNFQQSFWGSNYQRLSK
jgi:hypothetical protein